MNILKGRFLSRRAVLRGAGYTVGLPFLDVMAPARARAQGAQTPRFLAVFAPCGFLPSAWAERRKRRERSVLDGLLADAARLQGKLGAGDRARVDQHLTSLRELERQLELLEQESVYTAPDSPNITDIVSRVRAMSDVALAAIRCGRTRVLTLMLGNGASFQRYPFTTSGTTHHDLSHSPTEQGRLELAQIDPWMVEQFAYLLLGLQAIDDGNGMTALDNTFSMYGSELADGSAHTTTGYKIILGGRAGGRIAGNQHIVATGQPTANVLPTAGQMCGVPLTSFGDSTGPIAL